MMKNAMIIDQEAVQIFLDLIKSSIQDGSESIMIGDLEYVFPELVDRAREELEEGK